MTQEAQMALRAAENLARKDRWPAGLLPAVQLALADADPIGPDTWRGQGARWEAVADALLDVAVARPADADRLSRLLVIAQGGAQIGDSPLQQASAAGADFVGGVAADVRSAAQAVPAVAASSAQLAKWVALLGVAGLAVYYLAEPGRRGR